MTSIGPEMDYQDPVSAPFLALLDEAAAARGDSEMEMWEAIGVTAGYGRQLRRGIRRLEFMSLPFARACAAYTGLSLDTVVAAIPTSQTH